MEQRPRLCIKGGDQRASRLLRGLGDEEEMEMGVEEDASPKYRQIPTATTLTITPGELADDPRPLGLTIPDWGLQDRCEDI